ncbi:YcaO-like family protein [Saccharothrix violaceirubra]|uniref:Ribosomal protein S12 methylthiotransferase accessory factor n=1 Tax=Saccharothrix violaceirubra TaxID=413306 RepID=A0A7W7T5R1_9PSEU|nr:YcaO-like family protein [Saccharothrix violaceirubra]MBB4965775.1 ribosomal protein S12 methylthiotransferase accessory factor [Saccharothrix violaceirubra]
MIPHDETLNRIGPVLTAVGVTRLADVTWLDEVGIPCWQAVRPTARTLSVSQGKGLTPEAAAVSAAMEAIEVWHAENLPAGPEVGSVRSMRDRLGYPVTALRTTGRTCVNDDLVLDWVPATRLSDGGTGFVPTAALRLDGTVVEEWAPPLFEVTSNGLASGPTRVDAVLHGLYEVIERDALAGAESDRVGLDLGGVDEVAAGLVERFERAGVAVAAYLVPSPVAVPCVEVRVSSEEFPVDFRGSAAHLDGSVALHRALTEAAQSRVAAIAGTREDLLGDLFGDSWTPAGPAVAGTAALPAPTHHATATAVEVLAARVTAHTGHSPLVVEHTRDEFAIPVVRVVCPGLDCPHDY